MQKSKLAPWADWLFMFLFTIIGVMALEYLPAWNTGGDIEIHFYPGRFVISLIVGFVIMGLIEIRGNQEQKRGGGIRKFATRGGQAMGYGLIANVLIQKLQDVLGIIGG